ncbi:hypothetical protein GCK72_014996 [Caenorhabditis remanei]|uniref:Uncharacterized protein n=1 Tax=Caenorhabditis remanei TaxID=31234 RepID=A0A6A5GTK1_CAERE|nr:hypothetical protein GCK72_014996 [Caenorhabditis remanei]KAF1758537.1 hypothetical protein GCK72_014996 [Caenorhabditis remanei]
MTFATCHCRCKLLICKQLVSEVSHPPIDRQKLLAYRKFYTIKRTCSQQLQQWHRIQELSNQGARPLGVTSRITMQIAGVLLILAGIVSKFAAFLSMILEPIIGGLLAMGMCLINGVSLSNLAPVDMKIS